MSEVTDLFSKHRACWHMPYFIKRGTTVKGPFSHTKLKTLIQDTKLKKNDNISESADGPWEPIATAYKRILSSSRQASTPRIPTINDWAVKHGLLGKYKIDFECPQCNTELRSDEGDIGQRDCCQKCGLYFILSPSIAEEIAADRKQRAAQKKADTEEKQRQREEEQRLQKRESEERIAAVKTNQIPVPGSEEPQIEPDSWDSDPISDECDFQTDEAFTTRSSTRLSEHSAYLSSSEQASCWYCEGHHINGTQCSFCRMIQ